ncbi:conserved hypothetical protein [metagenome]|uniref:Uncharacterized protein n=1 Tax=metagenome TaxID=256318 RepID=A0A2P2C540_9ZZZZ
MIWIILAVLLATQVIVARVVLPRRREAKRLRSASERDFALLRKVADEDLTQFGAELQQLHLEALDAGFGHELQLHYQRALDAFQHATGLLRAVRLPQDVAGVTATLEDARWAGACLRARLDGHELPQLRPPCFFNPTHGPARIDVPWAPSGSTPRDVPVCARDAERLRAGEAPDVRRVRIGGELVAWYEAGPSFASYARGWMGPSADWRTSGYHGGGGPGGGRWGESWQGDTYGSGFPRGWEHQGPGGSF